MKKVALVIIYNHNYEKNIKMVESYYQGRFSNIYHLMPFYRGVQKNVILVNGDSLEFQSFIAQSFPYLIHENMDFYCFVGDDCLINPYFNERNILELLELDNASYISRATPLGGSKGEWAHINSIGSFPCNAGAEIAHFLPESEFAEKMMFRHHGINAHNYYYVPYIRNSILRKCWYHTALILKFYPFLKKMNYPLVRSYSDFCVVQKADFEKFAFFCAITAAQHLMVEIALPTSLLLASKKVKFAKDHRFVEMTHWGARSNVPYDATKIKGDKINIFHAFHARTMTDNFHYYGGCISRVFEDIDFALYAHPLKLSKWKV